MNDELDLDRVLLPGKNITAGSFRFFIAGQRWEWSDAVAAMHGYAPGEAVPTTDLLLSHKHPDDKTAVAATLARTLKTGEPFSGRHRIIDTAGEVHHVVVVGQQMLDETTGQVIGTSGFYLDVSDSHHDDVQAALDQALPELARARAAIDQAKGALMLIYGVSSEQAFDVLVWRSQETNTKLRTVAEHLIEAMRTDLQIPGELRSAFDHLLLRRPAEPSGGN